jgi:hypothetical protein
MKFLATLFLGIIIGVCVSTVMPCVYAKAVIGDIGINPSNPPAHSK